MKAKTIKSHLRWKINQWIASITDPEIQKLAQENTIVTGGSIVSLLTRERVNDYDIYFRTLEAASRIAQYYVAQFKSNPPSKHATGAEIPIWVETTDTAVNIVVKSAGIASSEPSADYQYFESQPDERGEAYVDKLLPDVEQALEQGDTVPGAALDDKGPPFRPVFLSSNAITLSHGIQLVIRFIGEPEVIHKYYDYIHCTCYWKSWDGELVLPQSALESILTKELRYSGSLYPLCSIIRLRKFIARGWTVNAGQILKMCMQLNELDLKDINVLQDQLTGVDAFYFMQILQRLREKQKEDGTEGQPIDSTYLMTIIDRLF